MNKSVSKNMLNNFFEVIEAISNKNYQRRIWIKGIGLECDSYEDCVNDFFDIGESILENYKDYGITEKQYTLLKKFHDKFESFTDDSERPYLPQDFIDTPEWTKITEMAKEVLAAFNYQKK